MLIIEQIGYKILGIVLGLIIILAGFFNWKSILSFNLFADIWVEIFGLKFYRVLYIIMGVLLIVWIISNW